MFDEIVRLADLRRDADTIEGALTLTVAQPAREVWNALTAEGRLAQWLAPGSIEPRLGGAVHIAFENSGHPIKSRVAEWQPQRRLAYSWSDDGLDRPVHWELQEVDRAVTVTLTVRLPAHEDAARALAGWAAHLEMLAAVLAGAEVRFPLQRFREARRKIDDALAALDHGGRTRSAA